MSKESEAYRRLDRAYGHLGKAIFEVLQSLMKDKLTERQREDLRDTSDSLMKANELLLLVMTQEEINEIRE